MLNNFLKHQKAENLLVKKLKTRSKLPGFIFWSCYLLVVRPLAFTSYFTSLGLDILICKMGIMIVIIFQD